MAVFFYGFAALLILSSVMVISSRNPVHAVLWLIFAFVNASGLMVLIGAEFLAMMLIIIYVGAVAVLFLFVVMMLDIKFSEFKSATGSEMGISFLIAFFLFVDLSVVVLLGTKIITPHASFSFNISPDIGSAYAIGKVLYTDFILPFQTSGIILFVAMIASIALTLRMREGVKRQNVSHQLAQSKESNLTFAKLDGKSGLDNLNYDN
ncbi:MAG: NADH:ubiquinone oxidoreductase subunit J [Rickettsiales bacterium]|nr:MAG: NADH:ubiquinone oxidoreductase subunit J [Rickettsiales bacterium]